MTNSSVHNSSSFTPGYTYDFTGSRKFKWSLAIISSLFSVLILIIFQPFGINNYQHELSITFSWIIIIFSFGGVGFCAICLNEFFIRPLIVRKHNLFNLLVWYLWEFVFVGSCNFLYYNYLGGFQDMYFNSWILFIINTSFVLILPFSGTVFYFRYLLLRKEYFDIQLPTHDKFGLNDIVLISGDYKKDKIALSPGNILLIESQDNYVALYYLEGDEPKKHLIRSSLSNMEEKLNFDFLRRCNRSLIANLMRVKSYKDNSKKLSIKLEHLPDEIFISKKYSPSVRRFLQTIITT